MLTVRVSVCLSVCVPVYLSVASYTKFVVKPASKARFRVAPMEHGHLMSAPFLARRRLLDAAVRVQSSFRSFQDRKVADLAARFAAYQQVSGPVTGHL